MTIKTSTFGGQLEHFAESVDIVNDNMFNDVRDLVCQYVERQLGGEYFELACVESDGNGDQPSLRTFWCSRGKPHHWSIRSSDGAYTNPITEAFDNVRSMWVVSPEKKTLDATDTYIDLWSGTANLSSYRPASVKPIKTLVVIPLSSRHLVGTFCMESSRYIEATDVAKEELTRLAEALAMLYELWEVNRANSAGKQNAINDLRKLLDRAKFPRLTMPHMFVPFSSRADETVKLAIKDVLAEFADRVEYTDWEKMYDSGNVMAQIGKEIMESRFGICYLSEPVESDGSPTRCYTDNPNVLFEAGMLHARTSAAAEEDDGEPVGWIPIREKNSPEAPFDFAAERILVVPRSEAGELNRSAFHDMLRHRIDRLLGQS